FGEVALHENAGDPRAHLDFARPRGLRRVLQRDRQGLRLHRGDVHFERRHAATWTAMALAALVVPALPAGRDRQDERQHGEMFETHGLRGDDWRGFDSNLRESAQCCTCNGFFDPLFTGPIIERRALSPRRAPNGQTGGWITRTSPNSRSIAPPPPRGGSAGAGGRGSPALRRSPPPGSRRMEGSSVARPRSRPPR